MGLLQIFASTGVLLATITVGRWGLAANICNETVPPNRIVDGIPAYSQCASTTNSTIYSRDGIDTSISPADSTWVRTQRAGGYQCTELAHRYLHFRWGIKSVPSGNADAWCDGTLPIGLEKSTKPVHGDLVIFRPGNCGADSITGHVAVVDMVGADAVTFVEQNPAGRRTCKNSTVSCYLHASANRGDNYDGGAVPDASGDGVVLGVTDAGGNGGTIASGGTLARGGAMASGGRSGLGGIVSTGGAVAYGGNSAGTTAIPSTGGTGGDHTTPPSTVVDSAGGCSFRLVGKGQFTASVLMLVLVGLVLRRRRTRQ